MTGHSGQHRRNAAGRRFSFPKAWLGHATRNIARRLGFDGQRRRRVLPMAKDARLVGAENTY